MNVKGFNSSEYSFILFPFVFGEKPCHWTMAFTKVLNHQKAQSTLNPSSCNWENWQPGRLSGSSKATPQIRVWAELRIQASPLGGCSLHAAHLVFVCLPSLHVCDVRCREHPGLLPWFPLGYTFPPGSLPFFLSQLFSCSSLCHSKLGSSQSCVRYTILILLLFYFLFSPLTRNHSPSL